MTHSSPLDSTRAERARYADFVSAMAFADPSELVYGFRGPRAHKRSPTELAQTWADAAASARTDAVWNMYLHVPYCKSICSFCNYKRLRVSSTSALDEYVSFIENEAAIFGPAVESAAFGAFYVGGGTPSVLNAKQLDRLFTALHRHFRFDPLAVKTFEYDPMVMTEDRFDVIRNFGFNRYSFGVQSIDVDVNALHNRGRQGAYHVDKQFALLGQSGGANTNVDFLLGLAGTTPEQMVAEIEEVLTKHRPAEVSIYFISPTSAYVKSHFNGSHQRFEAFMKPFEDQIPGAIAALAERIGYDRHTSGKHAILMSARRIDVGGRRRANFSYCDVVSQAHRPLYLLGLGDSARSRIFGRAAYVAEHSTEDVDPQSKRYIGVDIDIEDEMFSYVAHQLRDNDTLSRQKFRDTFAADITETCATQVDKLVQLGVVTVTSEELRVAKQNRRERVRDILFFFPQRRRSELLVRPKAKTTTTGESESPRLSAQELERLVAPLSVDSALPGNWTITSITGDGLTIHRSNPRASILVKLLEPAGSRDAPRSTKRFDLQYVVEEGSTDHLELTAALISLGIAIEANE